MKWTEGFIRTQKETPKEAEAASHKLMLRAGLIRLLTSGVYSYLPLGLRALQKVEGIIREEMDRAGATELLLPALQPEELWQATGRLALLGKDMIAFKDRHGRRNVLGPTHEEVITLLVKGEVKSYRQLPLILYQIQTKFRDEARPRFGVIRSREFIMKDAYSFDLDEAGLAKSYEKMLAAYKTLFGRMGLSTWLVEADPGVMGGSRSHEFMVPTESGEAVVGYCQTCQQAWSIAEEGEMSPGEKTLRCPRCKKETTSKRRGLEVGHIFQLGTKYTAPLETTYLDDAGKRRPILMGCYGVGVTRVLAAVIEQHHDEKGIFWPESVAPFQGIVLPLLAEGECLALANALYEEGRASGWELLLDDREERAGVKFNDAELVGIPFQLILGQKALEKGQFEIKRRRDGKTWTVSRTEIFRKLQDLYGKASFPDGPAGAGSSAAGAADPTEAVRDLILNILEKEGVELVDLVYRREGARGVLRILVDTEEGITLEECAALNRAIGERLDKQDLIRERYLLEVASPGLDRPLTTERDFQRALGESVRLFLKTPFQGRTDYEGILEAVSDGKVILRTVPEGTVAVPLGNLLRGKRMIEF